MKHTTEELLFAAAVRERALGLRRAKTKDMTDEELAAFDAEHPLKALIEDVMEELDSIAAVIAQVRSGI